MICTSDLYCVRIYFSKMNNLLWVLVVSLCPTFLFLALVMCAQHLARSLAQLSSAPPLKPSGTLQQQPPSAQLTSNIARVSTCLFLYSFFYILQSSSTSFTVLYCRHNSCVHNDTRGGPDTDSEKARQNGV